MIHTTSLDAAVVGMELAAAICDNHGTVLLPQGCVLTSTIISALQRRGIVEVTVNNTVIAAEPRSATDSDARINHVFRRNDSSADAVLKSAIRSFRLTGPT